MQAYCVMSGCQQKLPRVTHMNSQEAKGNASASRVPCRSNPKLIVADESVAALDVSVRAKVLDLMLELQETLGVAYLFISHDMAVIERMSHRVAVMQGGKIIEMGSRRDVFENPQQEYTRSLMAAVPIPEVRRSQIGQI